MTQVAEAREDVTFDLVRSAELNAFSPQAPYIYMPVNNELRDYWCQQATPRYQTPLLSGP